MDKALHILLADDDQDDHEFFKDTLELSGITYCVVTDVFNGREVCDYLWKRNSYQNRNQDLPNLLVLDLNMPLKDGFSVLEDIRGSREFAELPVYILSTTKDERHIKQCKDLGCTGFYTKPQRLAEWQTIVETILADFR